MGNRRKLRLVVTGAASTTSKGQVVVAKGLRGISRKFQIVQVVTGAQYGVDTVAFYEALAIWPSAEHVVCYPEGEAYNEALCEYVQTRAAMGNHHMRLVAATGGYLKRDDQMIREALRGMPPLDRVVAAFPQRPAEVTRSGTWATVRRGERQGMPVLVTPLDGSDPYLRGPEINSVMELVA